MDSPKLLINNINKKFGTKSVLEDISFEINTGEFVSLLGSSGCGKTTLLRIIMGIEKPDIGSVIKDGVNITNYKNNRKKRNFMKLRFIFYAKKGKFLRLNLDLLITSLYLLVALE